jgi:hypothetical protein
VAQVNDLSRSLTAFDLISTLVVVVEMSKRMDDEGATTSAARPIASPTSGV